MLSTAWHALARGGEVATASLTRADLKFGSTRRGERYVEVWLRLLKKRTGEHVPKIPQYIMEFEGVGVEHIGRSGGWRCTTHCRHTVGPPRHCSVQPGGATGEATSPQQGSASLSGGACAK